MPPQETKKHPLKNSVTAIGDKQPSFDQAGDDITAINELFMAFKVGYPMQYHKCFPDDATLTLAKQFWRQSLSEFAPQHIHTAIIDMGHKCEYLPTIHQFYQLCCAQRASVVSDLRCADPAFALEEVRLPLAEQQAQLRKLKDTLAAHKKSHAIPREKVRAEK